MTMALQAFTVQTEVEVERITTLQSITVQQLQAATSV